VLLFSLSFCAFRFAWMWLVARIAGGAITPAQRAEWMHFCGRMVLPAMGIGYRVEGGVPSGTTLIVANHLSYLDIVICSAAVPCAFVAKDEIAHWPAFGVLARLGGTLFLNRESRCSAWDTATAMASRLAHQVPVLFFPEGTSTDGSEVQRFNSALFEAAVESGITVTPAAVFYEPKGLAVKERDVCWYGDALFLPHLKQVLSLEEFTAVVRFGEPEVYPDRKAAAWRSHDAVTQLRRRA
jgi:1-acyl-sn-glycerol-3-phosphate acyltransferase